MRRFAAALASILSINAIAQTPPMTPDITGRRFIVPTEMNNYIKREAMIPMRDGIKLHTVIVVPKKAQHAPILLTRTPYNANDRIERLLSPHMKDLLPQGTTCSQPATISACSKTCAVSTARKATTS